MGTYPQELLSLIEELVQVKSDDSTWTIKSAPIFPILGDLVSDIAPRNIELSQLLNKLYAALTADGAAKLQTLTYTEYKEARRRILDAKKKLYFKNLSLDDQLKSLLSLRRLVNSAYRRYIRKAKKTATNTRKLLYKHRPEKPLPTPPALEVESLWLLQRRNFRIRYYTHFTANKSVKPILYRRGFNLWNHWVVSPPHWEYYGEDYPGPFHSSDFKRPLQHRVKYGRKGKKPYVLTGIPYLWQTYFFSVCVFRKGEVFARDFTFKVEAAHPTTTATLEDKGYFIMTITLETDWRPVDKDGWLLAANAGLL